MVDMIDSKSIAFLMRGGSNPLQGRDGRWGSAGGHKVRLTGYLKGGLAYTFVLFMIGRGS